MTEKKAPGPQLRLYRTVSGKIVTLPEDDDINPSQVQPWELTDFEPETMKHFLSDLAIPTASEEIILYLYKLTEHKDKKLQKQLRKELAEKLSMTVKELEAACNPKQEKPVGEVDDEDEQTRVRTQYVFDPDKVAKKTPFTFCKLPGNGVAFGLLLPKVEPVMDGKNVIGSRQGWCPALITSNPRIYEASLQLQNERHIIFESIPSEMELRWELPSIEMHLDKQAPIIDGKALLQKIRAQYEKYLFFQDPIWYDIHALWDMGTYFHQLFFNYPLFELRGMPQTGKSKIMEISRNITFNASPIMVNPSAATLFRETHDKRMTKYMDEAEKLFIIQKGKPEGDERVELINASYGSAGTVPRVEEGSRKGTRKVVYYHVYSPTMLGSINGLHGATEDRAIIQITTRSPDADNRGQLDPEADKDQQVWKDIRNELYLLTLQQADVIEVVYRGLQVEGLKKRDMQIWRPLLALASAFDAPLRDKILAKAKRLTDIKQSDVFKEGTLDHKLLVVTAELVKEGQPSDRVHLKDIKARFLTLFPEEQNAKYPLKERNIAAHLDKLGFREFRQRDEVGNYYELAQTVFYNVAMSMNFPILPTQSTLSTFSIVKEENIELQESTGIYRGGASAVAADDSDDSVDVSEVHTPQKSPEKGMMSSYPKSQESWGYEVLLPCQECGATPCRFIVGIPFCKAHAEAGK